MTTPPDNTHPASAPSGSDGVVRLRSRHPVAVTVDRLEALLKQRGIIVFARIDFSGDAERAGLTLLPEQQLIFGNPKAGTPLMITSPATALDLPLRAVCWEAPDGGTWLAYNDPAYIVKRHGLPAELAKTLAAVVPLLERAASADG
jgi:uncharacterized protein (DUF302 family)